MGLRYPEGTGDRSFAFYSVSADGVPEPFGGGLVNLPAGDWYGVLSFVRIDGYVEECGAYERRCNQYVFRLIVP